MALVLNRRSRQSLVIDHTLSGDRILIQFKPYHGTDGRIEIRCCVVDEARHFHVVRAELLADEPTARSEIKRQREAIALSNASKGVADACV